METNQEILTKESANHQTLPEMPLSQPQSLYSFHSLVKRCNEKGVKMQSIDATKAEEKRTQTNPRERGGQLTISTLSSQLMWRQNFCLL
jgi:hypothetical protein